jgi:hypothetical protein
MWRCPSAGAGVCWTGLSGTWREPRGQEGPRPKRSWFATHHDMRVSAQPSLRPLHPRPAHSHVVFKKAARSATCPHPPGPAPFVPRSVPDRAQDPPLRAGSTAPPFKPALPFPQRPAPPFKSGDPVTLVGFGLHPAAPTFACLHNDAEGINTVGHVMPLTMPLTTAAEFFSPTPVLLHGLSVRKFEHVSHAASDLMHVGARDCMLALAITHLRLRPWGLDPTPRL